jgi:hypothetical protein
MTSSPVRIYIPIDSLDVDSKMVVGDIVVWPASHVGNIIRSCGEIVRRSKNTEDEKKKILQRQERMLVEYMGASAIMEVKHNGTAHGDKLIPDDLSDVYRTVNEVLATLHLMQRVIAGRISVERQKFGLAKDLHKSLNGMVAITDDGGRYQIKLSRDGNLCSWGFSSKAIREIEVNPVFCYLAGIVGSDSRNDLGGRVMAAVTWYYDAALDLAPTTRFIKLIACLEVLFVSGRKGYKSFRIARLSVLLDHIYGTLSGRCLCPILESTSYEDYARRVNELNLPGYCSSYWNSFDAYGLRSKILHDAYKAVTLKEAQNLEWKVGKLLNYVFAAIFESKAQDIRELEFFLENKYRSIVEKRQGGDTV